MALLASQLKVGDTHEEQVVEDLKRTQLVQYAGASGDYNPVHTDEVFVTKVAGYPSVFAHGMLSMGMTGKMLTNYVGDGRLTQYGGALHPSGLARRLPDRQSHGKSHPPRRGWSHRRSGCLDRQPRWGRGRQRLRLGAGRPVGFFLKTTSLWPFPEGQSRGSLSSKFSSCVASAIDE